ncbi:twin transmembrane helix small protein [Mongoliimonas terrestris]|uniref:twin transmembrane helix small protein n=1 Tax=Mongoliimonas terrestris TaxID=1709001 RepID=UPI0009499962|nr:twin transmembrane helix small protein [Mongoliimonas terrestris]
MLTFVQFLLPVALAAVAIVLFLGLGNMIRGGSASRSQTLMRWRIGLQGVAVAIIMLSIWLMGR